MTVLSTLPPPIRAYLDAFVIRRRRAALARAAGVGATVFVAWMLACCTLDRFAHLPQGARLTELILGLLAIVASVARPFCGLWHPIDCVAAAEEAETNDPRFGQRLVTVTSRLLGGADYRGSDEILIRLTREVGEQVTTARPAKFLTLRPVVAPWATAAGLVLFGCALSRIPGFGLSTLSLRFMMPLANIPPVTTTHLTLAPGDRDLVQSQPLTIEATAARLGDAPVTLWLNDEGDHWSHVTMSPAGGERFTFSITSVDRDLRYYASGGDAQTPEYVARVLRRPTVAQFKITYDYPDYTRLPRNVVYNNDGHIEGPAETRVTLAITSTEPLKAALLAVNGERRLMTPGADPGTRQAEFVIHSSGPYGIDLISARDVAGSGPAGMAIHAVPDLPPQVRLARGGDSVRLNPRDIVPVWYEAIDDYGIKSLAIVAEVNGQAPVEAKVPLWGDPRRQQGSFNFDLATLPLGIGDVVKLSAVAIDTAGHRAECVPMQVIVSPRSVDMAAWERIGELRAASQLSQSLSAQFDDAVKAQSLSEGQTDHTSAPYLSAESQGDRALSAASQTSTLLRQSLLRAITHSNVDRLSLTLSGWVDETEIASAAADDAFRLAAAPGGVPAPVRERLRNAADRIRQMSRQVAAVAAGEQAAAVLADLENLQAARKRAVPKDEASRRRLRETVERMRQDLAAEASQVGLDDKSGDFENHLHERIRAAQAITSAAQPVAFADACVQWAAQIRTDPQQRLGMDGRLAAAAQAEALRPDAELQRARDLEFAARAAGVLSIAFRSGGGHPNTKSLDDFVADLRVLTKLKEIGKDPSKPPASDVIAQARRAAAVARQDLVRLAGDAPLALANSSSTHPASASTNDERQKDAEMLALQASAAAADHDYGRASSIDGSLIRKLTSNSRREQAGSSDVDPGNAAAPVERLEHHGQAVARDMAAAVQLDTLGKRQQELSAGASTEPSEVAADRQQAVADQIGVVAAQAREGVLGFNAVGSAGREHAASEVLAAQEQLSSMPQAIAMAETAAADRREAAMRAEVARSAARSAPADERAAAERAASEAEDNARDAAARLTQTLDAVAPKVAQAMADRIEPFAPETDAARAQVVTQLLPALQALGSATKGEDAAAVGRAANETRRAIETCQRELAAAQDALVQRDPLLAAKWYATRAAKSLTLLPPDVGGARAHQASASAAIWQAWDQSIHRAATERLAAIPSMAAVLGPPTPAPPGNGPQQGAAFAAARAWERLRPQDGPDFSPAMHDADPPGYEESLKLYFEALGKAQGAK